MGNDGIFRKEDVYLAVGKTLVNRVGMGEQDSYTHEDLRPAFSDIGLNPPLVFEHLDVARQQREERELSDGETHQRLGGLEQTVRQYEEKQKKREGWQSFGKAVGDVVLYVPRKIGDGVSSTWDFLGENVGVIVALGCLAGFVGLIGKCSYDKLQEIDYMGRAAAVSQMNISEQEKDARLRGIVTEALDHYHDVKHRNSLTTPELVIKKGTEYFSELRQRGFQPEEGIQLLEYFDDYTADYVEVWDLTDAAETYLAALKRQDFDVKTGFHFLDSAREVLPSHPHYTPRQLVDSAITIMQGK